MTVIVPHDLTPTEHRLLSCLGDLRGHAVQELLELLFDPLSSRNALEVAINRLRKKLEQQGVLVVTYRENGNLRYMLAQRPEE